MAQFSFAKRLNNNDYVDMAIKNVLEVSPRMLEKEGAFQLKDVKNMKILLINELENICIGAGLISKTGQKFDVENMDELDKKFFHQAVEYFNKKMGFHGTVGHAFAKRFLKANIEGDYYARMDLAKEKITKEAKKEGRSQDFIDLQLANYKLQYILREIKHSTPDSEEYAVGYVGKDEK